MRRKTEFTKVIEADDIRWYYYKSVDPSGEKLADKFRNVIEKACSVDPSEDDVKDIIGMLDILANRLDKIPPRQSRDDFSGTVQTSDVYAFLNHDPIIGKLNPIAPFLEMKVEGKTVIGKVNFGKAYEGRYGIVHGGFIASAFDCLLGGANAFCDNPGVTGTLSVRYMAPTPTNTDLHLEARFDRAEGRKVFVKGKMFAGDIQTASAEGIFISLK